MRIPDDLSVLIWGQASGTELHDPPLDALELDYTTVGAAAGEIVLQLLSGQAVDETPRRTYSHVRRSSMGAPQGVMA